MHKSKTIMLSISGFLNPKSDDYKGLTKIKPNEATRFAFTKDGSLQVSNEIGVKEDGKIDLIDAVKPNLGLNGTAGYDRVLIIRIEKIVGLTDDFVQTIGQTLESYMAANNTTEFATAAIGDIGEGQNLLGRWETMVLTRATNGRWNYKAIGFTSVAKSTNNNYAILKDGKMAKINCDNLVATLLEDNKLQALLDRGYTLDTKKAHLVRAPINQNGAYAVIDENGGQTVYGDDFNVIAYGQTGFLVMPTIDVDGASINGKVTTVSRNGDTLDVRTSIPASKAGDLASAYGAIAAT